jgi:hypothetical protein
LILALLPASAEAKKKRKRAGLGPVVTVSAAGNAVTGVGQASIATARCPKGAQAIGGGFSLSSDKLAVVQSYRSGRRTWQVAAQRNVFASSGGAATATAYAYCRRTTRAVKDVTGTASLPSGVGGIRSASAACPKGSRLVGGGFHSTFGAFQYGFAAESLSTAPRTWAITMINTTSGSPTITAHAYCIKAIGATSILAATTSSPTPALASASATSPPCPAGKRKRRPKRFLGGGGFSSPVNQGFPTDFPILTESRIGPGAWVATAVHYGVNTPFTVTSQGVCF